MLEVEQISFQHLQWIYYRQAIDGKDSSGQYVQMEHAYHRGEINFKGYKPDGYLFKDGRHHFYEYRGTFFNFRLSSIQILFQAASGTDVHVYQEANGIQMPSTAKDFLRRKLQYFEPTAKFI